MKVEIKSKTIEPKLILILENEMEEFLQRSPELEAAIERLQQDAAFRLITGLPPLSHNATF